MTGGSESSFSFVSYDHPPGQCAGGTHPTGMHSCYHIFVHCDKKYCYSLSVVIYLCFSYFVLD